MAAAGPSNASPSSGPVFEYNENLGNDGFSQRRQFAWLERSKAWPELRANRWRPRKVIGKGGYGLCGVWDYIGNDKSIPRQVAVKQTDGLSTSLKGESKMMHLTTSCNTDHIVKLYKGCHRGQGTGISNRFDPLPFTNSGVYKEQLEVLRMYMEYLPNGDVDDLAWKIHSQPDWIIPEEHLRRMLLCFAKACMVLEYGTEDPNAPAARVTNSVKTATAAAAPTTMTSPWRPICHFDIKLSNIFVGRRDDAEHKRLEVFKLADFGLSRFAPLTRNDRADTKWIKGTQWRASAQWMSPEQFFENHKNRDIGSATNVWAMGAVLHRLLTNEPLDPTSSFMHRVTTSTSALPLRITGSSRILLDNVKCPYSTTFINLLCRCLTFDPAERIPVKDLLQQTEAIIKSYDSIPTRTDARIHSLTQENKATFNILPPAPGTVLQNFKLPSERKSIPPNAPNNKPSFPAVETGVTKLSPDKNAWQLKLKRGRNPKPVDQKNFPFTWLPPSPQPPPPPPRPPAPVVPPQNRLVNRVQGLNSARTNRARNPGFRGGNTI